MDKIDICNGALLYIGARVVERLDEAGEEARTVSAFYDSARLELLRRYDWEFATGRKHLAMVEGRAVEYRYAYRYPADAVKVRALIRKHTLDRDNKYKIASDGEGKLIYSNTESAYVEYTRNVKDTELFDPLFCECLMWLLASKIAVKITGDVNMASRCMQMYTSYYGEATGISAREDNEIEPRRQDFVAARFCEVLL